MNEIRLRSVWEEVLHRRGSRARQGLQAQVQGLWSPGGGEGTGRDHDRHPGHHRGRTRSGHRGAGAEPDAGAFAGLGGRTPRRARADPGRIGSHAAARRPCARRGAGARAGVRPRRRAAADAVLFRALAAPARGGPGRGRSRRSRALRAEGAAARAARVRAGAGPRARPGADPPIAREGRAGRLRGRRRRGDGRAAGWSGRRWRPEARAALRRSLR